MTPNRVGIHLAIPSDSVAIMAVDQETQVLILTGPPGAGKSTAAAIRAARGVHLRSDVFFDFVSDPEVISQPWSEFDGLDAEGADAVEAVLAAGALAL